MWTGVPVAPWRRNSAASPTGRRFMTSTGGEEIPEGIEPKDVIVERSVPLEAMDNAILAWEMNGEPIPLAHGGPLRVIVPGYYGVNNVKYVKRSPSPRPRPTPPSRRRATGCARSAWAARPTSRRCGT
jgi:sulfite oxidase